GQRGGRRAGDRADHRVAGDRAGGRRARDREPQRGGGGDVHLVLRGGPLRGRDLRDHGQEAWGGVRVEEPPHRPDAAGRVRVDVGIGRPAEYLTGGRGMTKRSAPLLEAVREAARERDPLADPRWEALARGELSPEQIAALREEPRAGEADAYEVFRPLDPAVQEQMVDRAMASLRPPPAQERAPAPASGWLARRRRTVMVGSAAVAAAAALVLVVRPGSRTGPVGAPLPAYAVELKGGDREVRAEPATHEAEPRLATPETRFE